MTVAAVVRKAGPTPGNGASTVYPFAFKVFADTDISVVKTVIATGAQTTLVLNDPLGYTIARNTDQNANPGGSITYAPAGVAMPATESLTIISVVPQVQGTHITNGGAFFANNIEDAIDKVLVNVQDLSSQVSSSVRFPAVDSAALNAILPAAALRANTTLGFDASGNVLVGAVTGTLVSAAMLPVVQAVTIALGRIALGLNVQDIWAGTAGGTANALTLTPTPALEAYAVGQRVWFKSSAAGNNAATTIAVSGQAAITAQSNGAAMVGGEIEASKWYVALFDGLTFQVSRVAPAVLLSLFTTKGDIPAATAAGKIARLGVGADGQAVHADSTQTTGLVYVDNPSRPNLLVNPNWQIDQINEGALYTVNAADVRGPDGWSGTTVGTGVFKLRTLVDPDNAALKCLEITCTTADAAIAAADDYFIYSAVEGYDTSALMAGTAAAQSITVQFKFKANVNGVYGVSIANSALNRRYVGSFTVADANEHEYTLTLAMDAAGAWLYTNGVGLYLRICLAAGANFQAAAGAWAAGAEQTVAAQVNFMSNIANVAYLKRVQILPGALVQPYRAADLQKELAKAQRYYAKTYAQGTVPATATTADSLYTSSDAAFNAVPAWVYPTVMRTVPAIQTYSTATGAAGNFRNLTSGVDVAPTLPRGVGSNSTVFNAVLLGAGQQMAGHATANARLS